MWAVRRYLLSATAHGNARVFDVLSFLMFTVYGFGVLIFERLSSRKFSHVT